MATLIEGGTVIGYQDGGHVMIPGGQVVFEGDRITFVGRGYGGEVGERIDAAGKLVMPGLVNHHMAFGVHMQLWRLDGAPANYFNSGLGMGIQPGRYLAEGPDAEAWRASARFAMASALRSGTTTFAMVPNYGRHPYRGRLGSDETLVQTVAESGLRAYLSLPYMSGGAVGKADGTLEWEVREADGWEGLAHAVEFARAYDGAEEGRIRTFLFPYQVDNCVPELLVASKEAARELGCTLKIHTAQYLLEFWQVLRRTGKTPIRFLVDLGFLGPEVSVAHAIFTTGHPWLPYPKEDESDLRLLAESGASVAHCPVVYLRTGFGLHSLSRYGRAGIPVSLGTDTSPHDMIAEMRAAALLGKLTEGSARAATAREVFDAATLGGARALQREDLGRLAAGAKADIVLVDLDQMHIGPVAVHDPLIALVYCAQGDDVETVIVDGVTRVRGGKVLGVDVEELWAGAMRFNERLNGAVQGALHAGRPIQEVYPPAFPDWEGT